MTRDRALSGEVANLLNRIGETIARHARRARRAPAVAMNTFVERGICERSRMSVFELDRRTVQSARSRSIDARDSDSLDLCRRAIACRRTPARKPTIVWDRLLSPHMDV